MVILVQLVKDPIQILEESPKFPVVLECWSNHDPEEILPTG